MDDILIGYALLAAVGSVALFMGITGNTRPIGGGIVAAVLLAFGATSLPGLLRDTGLAAIIIFPILFLVLCIGLPALGFVLYVIITAVKGTFTIKIGAIGRIASICMVGISLVGMIYLDQMAAWWKTHQEETAIRSLFPPTYKELSATEEKRIYNKSPEEAWALYQKLKVLLREKPLGSREQRNGAVLALIGHTMFNIEDEDAKRLQEKRLELLRDAETFWQTGDMHGDDKIVAALIIGDYTFSRPKPADDSIRERVLALKKNISRTQLWKTANRYGQGGTYSAWAQLLSILAWELNDAARKRSFDEFFNKSMKYSWSDAEQVICRFDGQESLQDVHHALTDLISDPAPANQRAFFYGLYARTHNDRWLDLADPKVLFKNSPELLDQELFFLSEISMLRGQFKKGLKERAEYILSKGFGNFIGGNDKSILLHGYEAFASKSCPGTYEYGVNTEPEMYVPCLDTDQFYRVGHVYSACEISQIYPGKIITYHFPLCIDREGTVTIDNKNRYCRINLYNCGYYETGAGSGSVAGILVDFEKMARSTCFPKEPVPPVTPKQRACVFDVIKKMDVHTEPAAKQ